MLASHTRLEAQKNFRSRGQLENVVHQQEHVVYPNHMHKSETFLKQSET